MQFQALGLRLRSTRGDEGDGSSVRDGSEPTQVWCIFRRSESATWWHLSQDWTEFGEAMQAVPTGAGRGLYVTAGISTLSDSTETGDSGSSRHP